MKLKKGYKQTEVGVIPDDWEVKPIGEITAISVGRDLKEDCFSDYQDEKFKYPVFSNTVSNEGLYGYYNVAEYVGDSLTVVGRGVGLGTAFKRTGGYGAIGRLLVLLPNKEIDANFLTEYINHKVTIFFESGGIPQLTGISFSKYRVPLPPTIAEQTAIATALSDTDALISGLEKLIAKKRNIKQGAMQRLLTPKEDWEVKLLGEIGVFSKGQGIKKDEAQSGEIPCIRYGEIYTRHNDYIKEFYSFISKEVSQTARKIKQDDILFAGSGETKEEIGKCIAFIDDIEAFAGGDIVILSPENVSSIFLGFLLNSPEIQKQKSRKGQGDAVVHISATQLSNIEILLPPTLTEQTRIATILSDMDTEITALETKLKKYKKIKQGMMQNLLTGKVRLI